MTKNCYIVKKVALTETFRNIPVGQSVLFDCREAGLYSSAKAAVSRLNASVGHEAYSITTDDNGVTYTVTHNQK